MAVSGIKILIDPMGQDPNDIDENADAVDIVAIHGIGADPDNTWAGRRPDGERINWLTDPTMLPKAIPTARIMRFGFESRWYGTAEEEPRKTLVSDVAEMLLQQLEHHRRGVVRPIVFVAHSYGGLVLMKALRRSFDNPQRWSNPFRYTAGLVFFGTPFRGRKGLSLAQIVDAIIHQDPDLQVYSETMALSVEENPYLEEIVDRFTEMRRTDRPIPLWCFYETRPSRISKTLLNNPNVKDGYLIPKQSACLDTSKDVDKYPLERDHYNLQKYPGPSDPGYQAVEDVIVRLADNAKKYLREKNVGSKKGLFMVPFGRNEAFVGRRAILNDLLGRLPPAARPQDCQRTALEGLGGVGKTQIALEAAYRVHDAYPDCSVFWLPAVNLASLDRAYRDIGQALGIKGLDDDKVDVRVLVHAALGREEAGPWLWIADNVDDRELLGKPGSFRLPFNRKGSILVTTRNRDVAIQLGIYPPSLLSVEAMNRPEAVELLSQGLRKDQVQDTASMNQLLDFLTDLPLAIKQASAFMAIKHISIARYLAHCLSSDKTLIKLLARDFGDQGRYEGSQNPITTTWLISFERIKRDTPLAANYLYFISFLSEKNIPRSLLPGDDEVEVDDALGTLKAYNFITERTNIDWFDIHRLVQLAMRNWLAEKGEQRLWRAVVIRQLDEVYIIPHHENKGAWIGYLPHAQSALSSHAEVSDKVVESRLLVKVGESSFLLGRYVEAEAEHRVALDLRIQQQGAEHQDTLDSMSDIGRMLVKQGQYVTGETMHRRTLELRTKVLGAEHPHTLDSMSNLAYAIEKQGFYAKAEIIHRQTLELRTKLLGPTDRKTLESMDYLANALDGQGLFTEAEVMYREILQLKTELFGPEHSNTLQSANPLALLLAWDGRYAEAEVLHDRLLELSTKVLGAEHPTTIGTMCNIAIAFYKQGRYSESESMNRRSLKLQTRVLGAEHPTTLITMNNTANALMRQGICDEAKSLHHQTLELRAKVLGPKHPDLFFSMHGLACSLNFLGRYTEAESLTRRALALRTEKLGAQHPETLGSMSELGRTLYFQGRYDEAESLLRQTLKLRTDVVGAEYPETLDSMSDLACLLYNRGRQADSRELHRQTLELRTKVLGSEHPDTLSSASLLMAASL